MRKIADMDVIHANIDSSVIWEWLVKTDQLWWNEGAHKLFGFDSYDHVARLDAWYNRIHPEERDAVKNSVFRTMEAKEREWVTEYRFLRQDGTYVWVADRRFVMYNDQNEPERILGTMVDVSAHKALQQTLVQQNKELTKLNEVLDNFVYTAAHDLKSPVSNLQFIMQLIRQTPDQHKKEELLTLADSAIARLNQTIKALVEVIQVQSDKVLAKTLRFADIFNLITGDAAEELRQSGGQIVADFEPAPTIRFVEAYLTSILRNLVGNAIKYRSPDRPLVIEVRTRREDQFVVLTIRDNGIGLDVQQHAQKLFKPFNRFTQQADGKGIGMYLVKSMVEKNGGRIEVASQPGQGTLFTIFLKEYDPKS